MTVRDQLTYAVIWKCSLAMTTAQKSCLTWLTCEAQAEKAIPMLRLTAVLLDLSPNAISGLRPGKYRSHINAFL